MAISKAELENKVRNEFLELIAEAVSNARDTDVLTVEANELAVPCVDAEGNEKWVTIKVAVPRGTRNGQGSYTPYDGYAAEKEYKEKCADRADKKACAEAKKQAKIARDEKKRAEKKAVVEANKNLKELRKIKLAKPTEEGDDYSKEYAPHELTDMLN